jgi:hypothetical protein
LRRTRAPPRPLELKKRRSIRTGRDDDRPIIHAWGREGGGERERERERERETAAAHTMMMMMMSPVAVKIMDDHDDDDDRPSTTTKEEEDDDDDDDDDDVPLLAACRHLLQPSGRIVGRDVANAILPKFPTFCSAIPLGPRRRGDDDDDDDDNDDDDDDDDDDGILGFPPTGLGGGGEGRASSSSSSSSSLSSSSSSSSSPSSSERRRAGRRRGGRRRRDGRPHRPGVDRRPIPADPPPHARLCGAVVRPGAPLPGVLPRAPDRRRPAQRPGAGPRDTRHGPLGELRPPQRERIVVRARGRPAQVRSQRVPFGLRNCLAFTILKVR